jgi:outer membrane protein TolC
MPFSAADLIRRRPDLVVAERRVKASNARIGVALAAYRQSVLRATEDVENTFSALVNSELRERKLAGGESSLTQARDLSVAAYKSGVVSLIEVFDADWLIVFPRHWR